MSQSVESKTTEELDVSPVHPAVEAPPTVPLDQVVSAIRMDAEKDAENYLDEHRVPEGGE